MYLKRTRVLLFLGAWVLGALATVTPASATDSHVVHGELHRGRIDLVGSAGTIIIDVPGSEVGDCMGSIELRSVFNYKIRTVGVSDLDFKLPFTLPIFGGTYQLEATGVQRSGLATWNHDGTHDWGSISERVEFEIQEFNEEGCVKGETVCDGGVELEFNGETRNARDAFPDVYVRGEDTEEIEIREPCTFLWDFLLDGARIRLEEVPNSGDPDAWFRVPAA